MIEYIKEFNKNIISIKTPVIPVCIRNTKNRFEQVGTAFLIFEDGLFIVTAKHVLDENIEKSKDNHLYIKFLHNKKELLVKCNKDNFYKYLNYDIVAYAPEEDSEIISTMASPLFFNNKRKLQRNAKKLFSRLYGYPASKNKIYNVSQINTTHMLDITLPINSSLKKYVLNKKYDNHIFFSTPKKTYFNNNGETSNYNSLPKFNGLSGGPIIKFELDEDSKKLIYTLEGIFIEWHKLDNIFIGVDVNILYKLITNLNEQYYIE